MRGRKVDSENLKGLIIDLQICASEFIEIIPSIEAMDLQKNIEGVDYSNTNETLEKLKLHSGWGDKIVNNVNKIKVASDLVITDNEYLSNEMVTLTKRWCGEKKRVNGLNHEIKILKDRNNTLSEGIMHANKNVERMNEEKNEYRQQLERMQSDRETYKFIMNDEREKVLSETINQLQRENETLRKELQVNRDYVISFMSHFNQLGKDNFNTNFPNDNPVNSTLKNEQPSPQLNVPLYSIINNKNPSVKIPEPIETITVGKCSLRDALDVIPKYDGKTNSIRGFISSCRSALKLLDPQWTQAFMLSIRNKITGPRISLIGNKEFTSLDELEELLRTVTYTGKTFESIWNELSTVVMNDSENVDEYGSRVLKLYNDLVDCNEGDNDGFGTMSKAIIEEKTIRQFIKGLLPEVRLRVECKNMENEEFLKV